jgi:hypothetical protein
MAKLLGAEILRAEQIFDKIDSAVWHYDTTTQRQFIYNSPLIKKVNPGCGDITKAAYIIYNILEKGIILPAITVWHNTDTGDYNIHDGKQRSLSMYYFVRGTGITVYRHGMTISNFGALEEADQTTLLQYPFVVQYNEGTTEEEKENFYEVNSNSINLTDYENLRSVSFGSYIYSFEDYINGLLLDGVDKVGRGEQAYKFLLAMFDLNDSKQTGSLDNSRKRLRDTIALRIDKVFDPTENNFADMVDMFSRLKQIKFTGTSGGLSDDIALAIARFVVHNYPARVADVVALYTKSAKERNDILKWKSDFNVGKIPTHKRFIEAYLNEGLWLDPRRFFDDSEKQLVADRDGRRCAHKDEATGSQCSETSYNKLQVDHIKPWSKGGRTDVTNAQLLCAQHNGGKGAK